MYYLKNVGKYSKNFNLRTLVTTILFLVSSSTSIEAKHFYNTLGVGPSKTLAVVISCSFLIQFVYFDLILAANGDELFQPQHAARSRPASTTARTAAGHASR